MLRECRTCDRGIVEFFGMLSVYLAKVIGLTMLVSALALLYRRPYFMRMVPRFVQRQELILVSGFVSLILGLAIVVAHNVWTMDWRVLITIIGWCALIKGVVRVFAADFTARILPQLAKPGYYEGLTVVALLFGLYLTYQGYSV